jgi:acetyl-CoA carboxylase carboxyl transferase subunit alpha
MSLLKVPVICIIIGEGASGGALGIAVGDRIYMLENTWYSVISPESCSSILWRSWEFKEQAAQALKLTAPDMIDLKLIDGVIPEPLGGAHTDVNTMVQEIKKVILHDIDKLGKLKTQDLISKRMDRFFKMGVVKE